jgi:choline kinase
MEVVSEPTLIVLAAGRARRFGGYKPLAEVGAHGEAVIDLIGSDAYAAGFASVVIVVNPESGPLIEEHIKEFWPPGYRICFATQSRPLGTVHAVLAAAADVDQGAPFAVANADDLYGRDAMGALGEHLRNVGSNCLVGFRLDRALVGEEPATRGVIRVKDGRLAAITERRQVRRVDGGFLADDGLEPRSLEPETRVSMNLWGFQPSMWTALQAAMARATDASEEAEVLLPEMVGELVRDEGMRFDVLEVGSRCIGVTHAGDLAIVRGDVADQIARGERPERAFAR